MVELTALYKQIDIEAYSAVRFSSSLGEIEVNVSSPSYKGGDNRIGSDHQRGSWWQMISLTQLLRSTLNVALDDPSWFQDARV